MSASQSLTDEEFVIEGFHCTSCAQAVERALGRREGVKSVSATFATESVAVTYDPIQLDTAQLKQTIAKVGFRAYTRKEADRLKVPPAERDLRVRLARTKLGWLFGAPIFLAMAYGWVLPLPSAAIWAMAALAAAIQVTLGQVFYAAAYRAIVHARTVTTDVLVSLGAISAFGYSAVGLFLGWHPLFFDTASMVLVLITQGNYLKARATTHSLESLKTLARLQSRTAVVRRNDRTLEVWIDDVKIGERVLVASGSRIPLDGQLASDAAEVDEGALTGESIPTVRKRGEPVWAGTLNVGSPLELEVTAVGQDMRLTQTLRLVLAAQADKVRALELTDRLSRWFVPFVLGLAAVTAIMWIHDPAQALARAVAVLVIACPCALSLAPGTAIAQATARLASEGVLVTRASALERLAHVREVIFDKTGTLTEGKLELISSVARPYLKVAAALEGASPHPIARALREAAGDALPAVADRQETTGSGVTGDVNGVGYAFGRPEWAAGQFGHPVPQTASTSAVLADADKVHAVFEFEDRPRAESADVVRMLKAHGLTPTMLSGDHPAVVDALARQLEIDHAYASQRPEDKFAFFQHHRLAAMVGDGVNDAAALAQAHVGLAMGSGSDAAAVSADLILTGNDLRGVLRSREMGRAALRVIVQNLVYAFGFNAIALPLAMTGHIPPQLAALAMSVSSLVVVGNSLRLRGVWLAGSDPKEPPQGSHPVQPLVRPST